MADFDWHSYGVVVGSGYRKSILSSLEGGPKTPKQIATATDLRMSHVSKALGDLEELELVVCLTPKLHKGRVFGLTPSGESVAKKISGH